METKNMKIETQCLHSGYSPKNTEPRVVPIVQSTTYVYDSTEEVASVFDEPTKSLIYSRFANPTVMAVENKIAEMEGGVGAMCTSSGQAATLLSILNICQAGDSFLSTTEIYGGTVNLFSYTLKKLGIECIFVPKGATDEEIDKLFTAILGETLIKSKFETISGEIVKILGDPRVKPNEKTPAIGKINELIKPFGYFFDPSGDPTNYTLKKDVE